MMMHGAVGLAGIRRHGGDVRMAVTTGGAVMMVICDRDRYTRSIG
jgi:hypothetical protein